MKISFLLFVSLFTLPLLGQNIWNFPEPQVGTGNFAFSDTVYIGLNGSDSNDGSINSPVASFQKALSLLPFGNAGINEGNAYGLIRVLPGDYVLTNGWQQNLNQYQNGSTYKNVSLEGVGSVTIGGSDTAFANGHGVRLIGNHIYIRNLRIHNTKIHGISIGGNAYRNKHVLIDQVEVDSVQSFSMLISTTDTVLIRNSKGLYGSRPGFDTLQSPCQWPSGIKFYDCTWSTIHDSEIGYTRGEGLNFHNSEYGLAYNNVLHDNTANIYCDNSARIVLRNNINYADPQMANYWRGCPADTGKRYGCTGVLLANEGACSVGGPTYVNCESFCTFAGTSHKQIDSIFLFNNFFVNVTPALNMWQGNVDNSIDGHNCLRNVFFQNNTIIGATGDSTAGIAAMIYAFFPNAYNPVIDRGYAIGQNIQVKRNIISYDSDKYAQIEPIRIVRDPNFPVPFTMQVSDNRLIETDTELTASDQVEPNLPKSVSFLKEDLVNELTPCAERSYLLQSAVAPAWLSKDFNDDFRFSPTNVGALEYSSSCPNGNSGLIEIQGNNSVRVFPNPNKGSFTVILPSEESVEILVYNLQGQIIYPKTRFSISTTIELSDSPNGVYLIEIHSKKGKKTSRIIKM